MCYFADLDLEVTFQGQKKNAHFKQWAPFFNAQDLWKRAQNTINHRGDSEHRVLRSSLTRRLPAMKFS